MKKFILWLIATIVTISGATILSFDQKKEPWVKAIGQLKMPWRCTQGWRNL